jgi:hypothetical protein
MPHSGSVGLPTEESAERAISLSGDCEMVEQAALEASADDYQNLIRAVTQDMPWYYLRSVYGLQSARDQFNAERRYFYFLLAKKKKII